MKWPRTSLVGMLLLAVGLAPVVCAQKTAAQDNRVVHQPFKDQSTSTISSSTKDDAETIEIENATYEVTAMPIPGHPPQERLVIRKKVHTKEVSDEIDMEGKITVEAWKLGSDLGQKPHYSIKVDGAAVRTLDSALVEVSRGLEEVEWWSVYKIDTGMHLFDTYVPLVRFSISRETVAERYVGLEVPPDDVADSRLKEPHVVAVIIYASGERVIREALLTCDDPKEAAMYRSFADETRTVTATDPARSIKVSFSQNYPSAPATQSAVIPIAKDDLDLTHAQLPAHMHLATWKR